MLGKATKSFVWGGSFDNAVLADWNKLATFFQTQEHFPFESGASKFWREWTQSIPKQWEFPLKALTADFF